MNLFMSCLNGVLLCLHGSYLLQNPIFQCLLSIVQFPLETFATFASFGWTNTEDTEAKD